MANWLANQAPRLYTSSRQMIAGDDFNNVVAQLNSGEIGITAFAGGGIANAYQLKAAANVVAVVATAGDSVKLPKGVVGRQVSVRNSGANSMNVFPYAATGKIDNQAAGVARAVANIADGIAGFTTFECFDITNGVDIWFSK